MEIFVSEEGSGFAGTVTEFNQVIINKLIDMKSPKTNRPNTEYVASIANGSACVFRVNVGVKPMFIEGSMLAQISKGSLKIGFLDINAGGDIVTNIQNMIYEFWSAVRMEADGECAVMYSPQGEGSEF